MTNDPQLASVAMKIACVIAARPPYRYLAGRLARAALAGDTRDIVYWLRLARGVGVAPEPLVAHAIKVASGAGSAARAA